MGWMSFRKSTCCLAGGGNLSILEAAAAALSSSGEHKQYAAIGMVRQRICALRLACTKLILSDLGRFVHPEADGILG